MGKVINKRVSRSRFRGKRAWEYKPQQVKPKLSSSFTVFSILAGVLFIAIGVMDIHKYWISLILGLLSPTSLILLDIKEAPPKITMVVVDGEEDDWDDEEDEPRPNFIKKYLVYMLSAYGVGLFLGGWLNLFLGDGKYFWSLAGVGVVLSFFSRYNLKKHKLLAIIEDSLMYTSTFFGVWIIFIGFYIWSSNLLLSLLCILVGIFSTPLGLLSREKLIFKINPKNTQRKILPLVVVTFGTASIVFGVFNLYRGSDVISVVFIIEGILLLIGGGFVSEFRKLVMLKDVL